MGSLKSKNKKPTIHQDILEQLRCSFCKQYLSCAPIRLLPDGSSVCGRCSISNYSAPVYRELALEITLSRVKFPCCYKQYGCPEKLLFGHTIDHEAKCAYHPFACPSLPFTACTWHGSMVQVRDHFQKDHPLLMTWAAEFKLDVNQDKKDVVMVVSSSNIFLIRYQYEAGTTGLKYDVRYFSPSAAAGSYKIRLVNSLNPDNNINLKRNRCLPYTPDMSAMQNTPTLTVSKFLEVLDNPVNITVEIDLPSIKSSLKTIKFREFINYDQLELLRCAECQNYLALPIFDGPKGTVCSDCGENYTPSKNDELQRLIMVTNYPCRWNYCKFIAKGHAIRMHELICPYQPQACPSTDCKTALVVVNRNAVEFHLLLHGYPYFCKRSVYTSKFELNDSRTVVTTSRNNEIIVITHEVVCSATSTLHVFSLRSCKPGLTNTIARVYFEHSHCKLRSRGFILDSTKELTISAEMLPKCYRNKKMTLVVEM